MISLRVGQCPETYQASGVAEGGLHRALGAVPWAAGRPAGRLEAASDAGTEAVGQQVALSASSHTSHKCAHIASSVSH